MEGLTDVFEAARLVGTTMA